MLVYVYTFYINITYCLLLIINNNIDDFVSDMEDPIE